MTKRWLASARRHSYIGALALAVAGCPGPGAVLPAGAFVPATRDAFLEAGRETLPGAHVVVRFRWRSEDSRLSLAGAGAARIAPPDSIRVDMAASLGAGRSTVIMTGELVQANPAEVVDLIVPDRFALWSVVGVMRAPDAGRVERRDEAGRTWWKITDAAGRVTIFEVRGGVLATVRREEQGRLTQELRLERAIDGQVLRARLDDHARGARLAVDITGREASAAFGGDIWRLGP